MNSASYRKFNEAKNRELGLLIEQLVGENPDLYEPFFSMAHSFVQRSSKSFRHGLLQMKTYSDALEKRAERSLCDFENLPTETKEAILFEDPEDLNLEQDQLEAINCSEKEDN